MTDYPVDRVGARRPPPGRSCSGFALITRAMRSGSGLTDQRRKVLDIDPIWFGIAPAKLIEMSVLTLPVGSNLSAVLSAAGKESTMGRW